MDKAQELEQREKLLDRVRKLLALSQSPNEHEAALAAEKAQALLAEHNLSMAEIETNAKSNDYVEDREFETYDFKWVQFICQGVAELYFCGYWFEKYRNTKSTWKNKHVFVGEPHNIMVAKLMATYLVTTVNRLSCEGARDISKKEYERYRHAFKLAASVRLNRRLRDRVEQTKDKGIVGTTGTNLPALRPLYDDAQSRFEEYLKARGTELVSKTARVRSSHWKGTMDGRAAGDSISLDPQVDKTKREQVGEQRRIARS